MYLVLPDAKITLLTLADALTPTDLEISALSLRPSMLIVMSLSMTNFPTLKSALSDFPVAKLSTCSSESILPMKNSDAYSLTDLSSVPASIPLRYSIAVSAHLGLGVTDVASDVSEGMLKLSISAV